MQADQPILVVVGLACGAAAVVWGRSCRRLRRARRRVEADIREGRVAEDARVLATSAYTKEAHTTLLYVVLAVISLATAFAQGALMSLPFLLILVPVAVSVWFGPQFLSAARMAERRSLLERRAEEVLAQEELAPMRWAARLAPGGLPEIDGFEVGQVYQPGTGAMAGDFYDLYPTAVNRLVVVIGDVTGHGIEPSITAFQVKYLLRVFLRQYRDPGQAIEELNLLLSSSAGRPEELVSLCAVAFDQVAGSLRFASAGHPPGWLWHDGAIQPLRSTGPLLTLDPKGSYTSREVRLDPGDVLLLYTDGVTEARSGEALFGEERVAGVLGRDPGQDVQTLCKAVLEAAQDFASDPISDDIAIVAIRRT